MKIQNSKLTKKNKEREPRPLLKKLKILGIQITIFFKKIKNQENYNSMHINNEMK